MGLSKRRYGIFNSFAMLVLVCVMCFANGWVASIRMLKSFSFIILMISSFGSGQAMVSSLPPCMASFAPYSVVVVVRMYASYLLLINSMMFVESLVPPSRSIFISSPYPLSFELSVLLMIQSKLLSNQSCLLMWF